MDGECEVELLLVMDENFEKSKGSVFGDENEVARGFFQWMQIEGG